jgi:predicted HTH transcriptional regulator
MTLPEEIQNGENAALEFKEARPNDSLKFTKTVVAFANGRGGRILFGVEDKTGRLVGIPRDKVAAIRAATPRFRMRPGRACRCSRDSP